MFFNFIEKLVDEFGGSDAEINHFQEKEKLEKYELEEAIKKAAWAGVNKGPYKWTSNHQTRISQLDQESSQKIQDMLLENLDNLRECSSFEDLLGAVGGKIKIIKGTGGSYPKPMLDSLTIYDTSVRIGAFLGIMPKKVYLHPKGGDTIEGAKALAERADTFELEKDSKRVEVDEFPDPLQDLKPYEIEDFLCIKAEELKYGEISKSQSKCGNDNSNESNSKGCN